MPDKICVLGLTGGIATGKSAASAFLKSLGANIIDADAISRTLTQPGGEALPAIREAFGDAVFSENGELDRARLGGIVFENEAQRHKLEAIIHPIVQRRTFEAINSLADSGEKSCVLDVPLLYETGMDVLCDEVWVLAVDPQKQLERVMERGYTNDEALLRIRSQMSQDEKMRLATRVIWTDGDIQSTQRELESEWQSWLKRVERSGK